MKNQEILFGQTLEKVKRRAKEQGGVIAKEAVMEAFAPLALEEPQMQMVYDYLTKHGIGLDAPADIEEYLEEEERDFLKLYLEELSLLEEFTDGQKQAITLSAMAGESEAKKQLITIYLREAADLAKLYGGQGVLMEDLIGEANLALAGGVEMLGALEHASEVPGMLGRMMMDAMEECIAQNTRSDDMGKKAADQVNRVADAAKELSEELLRKVTIQELSAETGLSAEEIQEAVRLSGKKIEEIEE